MNSNEFCKIPIANQLRCKGLRRAREGEHSHPVMCIRNAQDDRFLNPDMYPIPEPIIVETVELEDKLDPLVVGLLVGFADVFFSNNHGLNFSSMLLGLCNYSEKIGATEQEIKAAIEQIKRERET